jgi:hypothetical protein
VPARRDRPDRNDPAALRAPTERERAARAVILGAVLGVTLVLLGRRR